MLQRARFGVAAVVGSMVLAAGWGARAQDPPAQDAPKSTSETIKDKVGGAVGSLKKGATRAEEAIKNQFAKAKDAVAGMGVEARVYSRLHWEKALQASKVQLAAPRAGVIVLNGTVSDSKARAKAVELAADTVGVTEVVDHLVVVSAVDATTPAPVERRP